MAFRPQLELPAVNVVGCLRSLVLGVHQIWGQDIALFFLNVLNEADWSKSSHMLLDRACGQIDDRDPCH